MSSRVEPESRYLDPAAATGQRPPHTFAAKRFDRVGDDRRLFASAWTMVGERDREPATYIEIAEAVSHDGAPGSIETDLAQLFRREVFNVLVGHRDDHLHNHGFLRDPGWRLAPAYDLNPVPDLAEHELVIGIHSHDPVSISLFERWHRFVASSLVGRNRSLRKSDQRSSAGRTSQRSSGCRMTRLIVPLERLLETHRVQDPRRITRSRMSTAQDGPDQTKRAKLSAVGSGGRTRTYDQAVNSRPLYH